MAKEDNFDPLYAPQLNGDGLRKFSDELAKYKGKIIEVYIGDQTETIELDSYSTPVNCSIYGRLVEVLDRFIVLNCYYFDHKNKVLKNNNTIYINSFQIRAWTVIDGAGSLQDIFLSATDAKKIRNLLLKNKS